MHKLFSIFASSLFSFSASAGTLEVFFADDDGKPVADVVIEIISPVIPVPEDWDYSGTMDQVDKEFMDNVITVLAGSYVAFPNSDDIQHHVYSFSDNNTFELPLYSGNEAEPVLFDEPGVSVIGCNIHDWMLGYIYVGESHLMAISDDSGTAIIEDLPEGNYSFKVWHERARRRDQFSTYDVVVAAAGTSTLELELNLGRDRRIRRAPTSSGNSYHQ